MCTLVAKQGHYVTSIIPTTLTLTLTLTQTLTLTLGHDHGRGTSLVPMRNASSLTFSANPSFQRRPADDFSLQYPELSSSAPAPPAPKAIYPTIMDARATSFFAQRFLSYNNRFLPNNASSPTTTFKPPHRPQFDCIRPIGHCSTASASYNSQPPHRPQFDRTSIV